MKYSDLSQEVKNYLTDEKNLYSGSINNLKQKKMEKFYSNTLHSMIQQINAVKAKRLYNEGETVFLQSSNMRFENMWASAYDINLECGRTFDEMINSFRVYNCDNERGNRIHFYIQVV